MSSFLLTHTIIEHIYCSLDLQMPLTQWLDPSISHGKEQAFASAKRAFKITQYHNINNRILDFDGHPNNPIGYFADIGHD